MQGDEKNTLDREKGGMIPRAVIDIFDELGKNEFVDGDDDDEQGNIDIEAGDDSCDDDDSATVISEVLEETQVFVSIYQIYNENVNDLL